MNFRYFPLSFPLSLFFSNIGCVGLKGLTEDIQKFKNEKEEVEKQLKGLAKKESNDKGEMRWVIDKSKGEETEKINKLRKDVEEERRKKEERRKQREELDKKDEEASLRLDALSKMIEKEEAREEKEREGRKSQCKDLIKSHKILEKREKKKTAELSKLAKMLSDINQATPGIMIDDDDDEDFHEFQSQVDLVNQVT